MTESTSRIAQLVALMASVCLVAYSAEAAEREFNAIPGGALEIVIERGVETVISRKLCTVILRSEPINKKKIWLSLGVVNLTDTNQVFIDTEISVQSGPKALKVYLADDIIRAEKRSQMWEDIAAGLVAGVNSYAAGQQGRYTETGTVSGTVRDGANQYQVDGTYRAQGFDYRANQAAINAANEKNARMVGELEARQEAELEILGEGLIYSQTITSGDTHSGRFQILLPKKDRNKAQQTTVSIPVCGETHQFDFAVDGPASALQSVTSYTTPSPPQSSANALPYNSDSGNLQTQIQSSSDAIVPFVTAVYIQPQKLPNGTIEDVVFFDVLWKLNQTQTEAVTGKLQLIDASGIVHVSMPWTIPNDRTNGSQFEEKGVGFPADSFQEKLDWLKRIHLPAITAKFRPDVTVSASPKAVAAGAPANATELQIVGSEFVLVDADESGNPIIQRTRVVPRIEGQGYAWMVRVNKVSGRVKVREEFTLPIAPQTWGDPPQGTRRSISSDGRTATSESFYDIEDEFIGHLWEVEANDPLGTYVLRVFIENAPPEVFEFQVQ
jgi:hypothetical protein